jgi:hypothetical protein
MFDDQSSCAVAKSARLSYSIVSFHTSHGRICMSFSMFAQSSPVISLLSRRMHR